MTLDRSKLKILLIDDQSSSALMLKSLFIKLGFSLVDIASSAEDAIYLARHNKYELLCVDYHLNHKISGVDLVSLLKKKHYLSPACSLLFISGDNSSETILTAMTLNPDGFLVKPLSLNILEQKLSVLLKEKQQRQPIFDALIQHNNELAIQRCKEQMLKYGFSNKLNILLLDLLVSQQLWSSVEIILEHLKHSQQHQLIIYKAKLALYHNEIDQAETLLTQLIEKVPLYGEAYDLLIEIYCQQEQWQSALIWAQKVLKLTPAVSARALVVADLAIKTQDFPLYWQTGKTLVHYLPVWGHEWLAIVKRYSDLFEAYFFTTPNRHQALQHKIVMKALFLLASNRLPEGQTPLLRALGNILLVRLEIEIQTKLKGKRRLLVGLGAYLNQMNKLPDEIILDMLPLLLLFGENYLYQAIIEKLSLLDKEKTTELKSAMDAFAYLEQQLQSARELQLSQPQQALLVYHKLLEQYPVATEVHLGHLECLYQLGYFNNHYAVTSSIKAISAMPLPTVLHTRREYVLNQFNLIAPEFEYESDPIQDHKSYVAIPQLEQN
ncbi:TPA: response regulator [Photobacterium damselae]